WAYENSGQAVPAQSIPSEELGPSEAGAAGADESASDAWALATGSPAIVVGEVDTGVDYEHPDLAANIWSSPGGIGGCSKGTRGYDILTNECNPQDQDAFYGGHGTHVAGIIGAVGGNGLGVAGVNWRTSILPVEWIDSAGPGEGETKNLAAALR